MTQHSRDDLWRDFPRTATEFEKRFATEEDCREIERDCDKIATDIRQAAAQRGVPSAGICSSPNLQIQKDFGSACTALKNCNDKVAECRE